MSRTKKQDSAKVRTVRGRPKTTTKSNSELTLLQKIIPPSILAVLTALLYAPTLNYPFQFDDVAHITKKFAIRFDSPITRIWSNSRWLGDWLNSINYQIGEFNPFYYRFFNVITHIVTGVILYFLILNLCSLLNKTSFISKNSLLIASTTTAFFLLHPLQTQTVMYVIQSRVEGVATLFVLAAVLFFTMIFKSKNNILKIICGASFLLISMLSCGTKETVIVLPLLLLIVDWFFISKEKWNNIKSRLAIYCTIAVSFFALMVYRVGFGLFKEIFSFNMTSGNNIGNVLTTHPADTISQFQFLISQFKVILRYLFVFIFPFRLRVEYDWKLSESFFALDSFFPFIILVCLLAFTIYKATKKQIPFFTFGILWFFVSIAPRSSILPAPELIYDYKTYMASAGIFFIFGTVTTMLLNMLYEKVKANYKILPRKRLTYQSNFCLGALMLLMLPISTASFFRNRIWRSNVIFCEDNVKKAPKKARVYNNYGVSLCEAGKYKEAINIYKTAIRMDKFYRDPLSNMAVAYSMNGQLDEAIDSLKLALHICPNYPEAYNNIGSLLMQKNNLDAAEKALNAALKLRPYYGKAFYNFARLYEIKKQPEKIWEYLKKATEGDLDIPEVFFKLGQMSLQIEKYDEAVKAFERVLAMGATSTQLLFNLGNAYFMQKEYDKASRFYEQIVKNNPTDTRFTYNLAETYFNKEEYEKSLVLFKQTTALPKPPPGTFLRVAECLNKLKKYGEAKTYLNKLLTINSSDEFKATAKNILANCILQEKLEAGDGSIKMSEFNEITKMISNKQTSTANSSLNQKKEG